jgi:hypothetical protein
VSEGPETPADAKEFDNEESENEVGIPTPHKNSSDSMKDPASKRVCVDLADVELKDAITCQEAANSPQGKELKLPMDA